jgi:hypothetical protein
MNQHEALSHLISITDLCLWKEPTSESEDMNTHTHTHREKRGEEDDGVRDMTAVLLNPIVQKMQFAK